MQSDVAANTALVYHNNKILALQEGDKPCEFTLQNLTVLVEHIGTHLLNLSFVATVCKMLICQLFFSDI
jgi:carotenoid cleavage dioxygenase-like enzyme